MKTFNWKRLKYWKIDFYTYEVFLVSKLPKKYSKDDIIEKRRDCNRTTGVCDTEEKKIFVIRKQSEYSPSIFLEDLFHELEHAVDHSISIDIHMDMINTISGDDQEELFYDLRVDQRSLKRLSLMYDNPKNFQYLLDWFHHCKTGATKKR